MKRMISLLLCLALLLPMTALADAAFYRVFGALYDESVLGEPTFFSPLEESSAACILMFNFADGTVSLIGDDEEGKTYGMTWEKVDSMNMFALLTLFCEKYQELDDLDPLNLAIGIRLSEDEEPMFVTNAADAATVAGILKENLGIE